MKTNEQKSRMFALVATLLSILAFGLYNWKNFSGANHPNVSSWSVWAFLTILNFTSYKKVTGDWIKSILPTVNSGLCIVTVAAALYFGSIRRLESYDQICFWLGLIAGLVWWKFQSSSLAQLLLQIAIVIGFIPTILGTWNNPTIEPSLPWQLWTFSFIFQFFAVKFTWKGKLIEFLYPVNMIIWHAVVFGLAVRH